MIDLEQVKVRLCIQLDNDEPGRREPFNATWGLS